MELCEELNPKGDSDKQADVSTGDELRDLPLKCLQASASLPVLKNAQNKHIALEIPSQGRYSIDPDQDTDGSLVWYKHTDDCVHSSLYGSDTLSMRAPKPNNCEARRPTIPFHGLPHICAGSARRKMSRRLSVMDFRKPPNHMTNNNDVRPKRRTFFGGLHSVSLERIPEKELDWLDGDGFLERLETETDIDTEILQHEVDTLRTNEPDTCRQQMLNILTCRLFTFIVLLVCLLDAVAIMTQIIMDIQANHLKSEYIQERDAHLLQLLDNLKTPPFNQFNATDPEDLIYFLTKIVDSSAMSNDHHITNDHYREKRFSDTHASGQHLSRSRRAAPVVDIKKDYHDLHVPYEYMWIEFMKLSVMCRCIHYISLTLLSFLVIEVLLKIIGFGLHFFKRKVEMVDAVVVISSFILDVVFMNDNEKNVPVVIFLFVWQLVRVISAMVFQNKKRVEFLLLVLRQVKSSQKKLGFNNEANEKKLGFNNEANEKKLGFNNEADN